MGKWLYTILGLFLINASPITATTYIVERGSDLQSVIDFASTSDTIILGEKTFTAQPTVMNEPLCGNCQQSQTDVKLTYGYIIKDKALVIIGRDRQNSKLITNAGYGIYLENSIGTVLKNFTVTGGKRDADPNATNAGIVVRNSMVTIEQVDVVENLHRLDTVVVGIGGIFGREGAEITVRNCLIKNNGWDGLAMYRGAVLTVSDCIIQNGRGVGIGITWDATCFAYRNEISGYWKGIGAFGISWVIARNNLVHDNLGWGFVATGQSYMDITNNVIYHNGNCGIAPWSTESRGRIINNIVVKNGWRDEWVCACVGVWNNGDWAKWEFSNNIVWDNVDGNYKEIFEQTGIHGNLSVDPGFVDEENHDFRLSPDSPAINAGDTLIYNHDGSVSHLGLYGGPQAKR